MDYSGFQASCHNVIQYIIRNLCYDTLISKYISRLFVKYGVLRIKVQKVDACTKVLPADASIQTPVLMVHIWEY
jgi:hypothetical protein